MARHEAARLLFEVATVPFMLLGSVHALATLLDARRPTFFDPTKSGVRAEMQASSIRLRNMFPGAPGRRFSMWHAWIGFNISHGLGVATFGLTMLIVARHDYGLVQHVSLIQPLTIAISAAYFLLSLRYWFYAPTIGCGLGLACFIAAAVLT